MAKQISNLINLVLLAGLVLSALAQDSITDRGSVMPNRTYYVTTIENPPYMMIRNQTSDGEPLTGNNRYSGFAKDLMDLVANYLGIEYELRTVRDGKYGIMSDSGWQGMVGELVRKEADFAIADITITENRQKVIDFTQPFIRSGISIMIKKSNNQGAWVFLNPFSCVLWITILVFYLIMALVLFLVRWLTREEKDENCARTFRDFVRCEAGCNKKSWSSCLVKLTVVLFTVILLAIYVAQLVIALRVASTGQQTPINSFKDLIEQHDIAYGPSRQGSTREFFRKTKSSLYSRVNEHLNKNPDQEVSGGAEGVARVREGKFAFLIEQTGNDFINSRAPCDTVRVGETINESGYGIATQLRSPYSYYLNLAVLHLQENGSIEKLRKHWWVDQAECTPEKKEEAARLKGQLSTGHICGLFGIVIIALIAAILIAIIELVVKSRDDAKQNNTTVYQAIKNNVTGSCAKKGSKSVEDGTKDPKEAEKDDKPTDQADGKKTEAA